MPGSMEISTVISSDILSSAHCSNMNNNSNNTVKCDVRCVFVLQCDKYAAQNDRVHNSCGTFQYEEL